MARRIIVAGLLGGLVMIGWTFVLNGIFGLRVALDMNEIADESQVHELLSKSIDRPGRYICNPGLTERGFPSDEPVFSVIYGGVGHGAAGKLALIQLLIAFIMPTVAAWMLSCGSPRVLSSYSRKVGFFAVLGLLIGLSRFVTDFGIGGYPATSALILFVHEIGLWTAVGLVVSWRLKPQG